MSRQLTGRSEPRLPSGAVRCAVARVELLTMAALALSTAIAATAVSIGIARADVLGAVTHGVTAPVALTAGATAALALGHKPQRD
ncbi:MAG: hypothetical protein IT537_16625 [Hyphomicrobiales bacterium]|nr:hypothetical protein [Hyphomicrobiales bacterium]